MRDTVAFRLNGKIGADISTDALLEAAEESEIGMASIGICIVCAAEQHGVEPDARRYPCQSCGHKASVYGAPELLLRIMP